MVSSRFEKPLLTLLIAALTLVLVAPSQARMASQKLSRNVCLTTGGGKFVDIPGFPGERIDRRLLNDIKYLEKRYKIFVTDGLSEDPVHAATGEHPIGLALDIVPNAAAGGTWSDVDALAAYAEPTQNSPISPFRWVGYDGDAGHGRGHHLHLSWNHSETKPGVPAASVYTLRCPGSAPPNGGGNDVPTGGGQGGSDTGTDGGKHPGGTGGGGGSGSDSGGVVPGKGGASGGQSGGIGVGRIQAELDRQAADPVPETGGVDS